MTVKYISQEETPWIILGVLYDLEHHNYWEVHWSLKN